MKKIVLSILLFMVPFIYELRAQIYSEAPITIVDGRIYTDMLYVKFTSHAVLPGVDGTTKVSGEALSTAYPEIRNLFTTYCRERKLSLTDISLRKAIPRAGPEDTVYVDVYTGERRKLPDLSRVFMVEFPKPVDIDSLITPLKLQPEVEYSHGPVQLVNCAVQPNDTAYVNGKQWYLDTLQAPGAWGISKGGSDIKIAIIETQGVPDQDHPDLEDKIVAGGDTSPEGNHATQVAGFAGAMTNNVTGIASLGWNIRLLTYYAVTAGDEDRSILAGTIDEAVADGADVINMSFKTVKGDLLSCGNPGKIIKHSIVYYYKNYDYGLVRDAVASAIGQKVVVVAPAGNDLPAIEGQEGENRPCEEIPYPCYPAQYPGVIAVSGSSKNGNFVSGWNYGGFVDVNAPGRTSSSTGLYTTTIGGTYTSYQVIGTSFSAPMVSALAALMKSVDPYLTPGEVDSILKSTADKVGQYEYIDGRNDYMGYGRINAHEALKGVLGGLPEVLTLENMTIDYDTVFTATDSIIAGPSFTVAATGDVTLRAGNVITLKPGFTAVAGSEFLATIDPGLGEGLGKILAAVPQDRVIKEPTTDDEIDELIPTVYSLSHGYPNPFNPNIIIPFGLPEPARTRLVVYDLLGREVVRLVDGTLESGYHSVVWNGRTAAGRDVPSGIYIARLITPAYTKSIKMLLLK